MTLDHKHMYKGSICDSVTFDFRTNTCDLWEIWSEWWENMTWPTKRQQQIHLENTFISQSNDLVTNCHIYRLKFCLSTWSIYSTSKSHRASWSAHIQGHWGLRSEEHIYLQSKITLVDGLITGLTTCCGRRHQDLRLLHRSPSPPQFQESACTRGRCCAWTEEVGSSRGVRVK